MKIIPLLAILTLAMMINTEAEAFTALGQGTITCMRWTEQRRTDIGAVFSEAWLLGFISGIGSTGVKGADPLRGVDGETVFTFVDSYCRGHSLDTILLAGEAFVIAHPR